MKSKCCPGSNSYTQLSDKGGCIAPWGKTYSVSGARILHLQGPPLTVKRAERCERRTGITEQAQCEGVSHVGRRRGQGWGGQTELLRVAGNELHLPGWAELSYSDKPGGVEARMLSKDCGVLW